MSGSFQFRRHRRVEAGSEANALPCRRIDLREVLQRQNQSLNELWADDPLPMSQITIPSSSLVLSEGRSQSYIPPVIAAERCRQATCCNVLSPRLHAWELLHVTPTPTRYSQFKSSNHFIKGAKILGNFFLRHASYVTEIRFWSAVTPCENGRNCTERSRKRRDPRRH